MHTAYTAYYLLHTRTTYLIFCTKQHKVLILVALKAYTTNLKSNIDQIYYIFTLFLILLFSSCFLRAILSS